MRVRQIKKQYYLNEEENEILKNKCLLTGYNEGSLIRSLLIGFKPKEKPPIEFYNAIKEIRKIGININQIALIANSTNKIDLIKLEFVLNELNDIIKELKNKYLKPDTN